MDEDRIREIIREELDTFAVRIGRGMKDVLLIPIMEKLNDLQERLTQVGPAKAKFREKAKTPLYSAILTFLQEHPGESVRPGEIAKSGVGAGPQPIGMVLKRMANEGVVDVESLPPDYTGYVAKKYRLKGT
jgi:hypothetical protein